ncbi:leucyl/phenylalanyl-tRNA--protein transferase [Corallincola holothuriorum]|uniref:Leucyl/phenylalanyl-tRNA--protein transferase n=1 Tax=Corallincola holothuriorum TaxID=2282215 RepID=A0A368NPE4_9GAMM|nr:leucyl/phenylalanyl-tRNA--protein transferase [Corallincola holothuriorum]RCU52427.1 leucyl/phenylalanyl-tRNA--protein transferase [Corallincola holothuriorum]
MTQFITELDPTNYAFPPTEQALQDPNGLLAIGGDLSAERLRRAYQSGIFPWFSEDEPLLWWSPDPRCVFEIETFRTPRSLRKSLRRSGFTISVNQAFDQVIQGCAAPRVTESGTWIVPEMALAYNQLHRQGVAHSIEIWHENALVGGLYGVCSGRQFSGESMFFRMTDASKVALIALISIMHGTGAKWIDCQVTNPHLTSLGAIEVSRADYIEQLNMEICYNTDNTLWQPRNITHQVFDYVGLS